VARQDPREKARRKGAGGKKGKRKEEGVEGGDPSTVVK
jgi:hypothetical protein